MITTRSKFVQHVVKPTVSEIESLLATKGQEYSGDADAFHNFRNAVSLSRTAKNMIQVLEGYVLKHDMSIQDLLIQAEHALESIRLHGEKVIPYDDSSRHKTKARIDEKFIDKINYLILLKGILYEIYGLYDLNDEDFDH